MALNNKLNAYVENLKLLVIKHKKVSIAAALALIVIISMIPVLFSQHQNTPSSTAASCDLKNMNGKMTCEEYEKDHKYRCEYSLSTGDKSGFDDKKLDDKTCTDLGYTWVDKSSSSSAANSTEITNTQHSDQEYTDACTAAIVSKYGDPTKKGAEYAYRYEKWTIEQGDGYKLLRSAFSILNDDKKAGIDPNGPDYYYGTASCRVDESLNASDVKQDFTNL